jgi:uncharacterized membrane protein
METKTPVESLIWAWFQPSEFEKFQILLDEWIIVTYKFHFDYIFVSGDPYKTEIVLSFIVFSCIFLCFLVFFLSFWPQNQSERKHREKVDRALRQF